MCNMVLEEIVGHAVHEQQCGAGIEVFIPFSGAIRAVLHQRKTDGSFAIRISAHFYIVHAEAVSQLIRREM